MPTRIEDAVEELEAEWEFLDEDDPIDRLLKDWRACQAVIEAARGSQGFFVPSPNLKDALAALDQLRAKGGGE